MFLRKLIGIFAFCSLLGACTQLESRQSNPEVPLTNDSWKIYQNTKYNYSINIPSSSYIEGKSSTGSQIFFGNVPSFSKPKGDEVDIIITTDISSSVFYYSCNEHSIVDPQIVMKTKNDLIITGNIPKPPCDADKCDDSKFGYEQYEGKYVLCSKNQGRTIRIEVLEVTDNPQLAEEIFKTFRWLR